MPSPARKQRSWLSRLAATGRPAPAASSRTCGFVRSASGKRSPASVSGRSAESMYVWSLAASAGAAKQRPGAVVDDASVVAGGQRGRPDTPREGEHRVDPHLAVADHTGVRRPPRLVAAQEPVDDGGPKRVLQVERQVGQAETMGKRSSADHRLRRAAAARPVVVPIRPQLQGHRHHLGAAPALEQRRDCGVDPAAHRHQHAVSARRRIRQALARRGRGTERAVKSVRGQLSGMAALRRESAKLGGDLGRPDPRRIQHAGALGQLGDRRAGRVRRCAALGVEARRDHATALDGERDPDQVAARGPAGGAAERAAGRRPPPRVIAQVVLERLEAHLRAPSVALIRADHRVGRSIRGDRMPAALGGGELVRLAATSGSTGGRSGPCRGRCGSPGRRCPGPGSRS